MEVDKLRRFTVDPPIGECRFAPNLRSYFKALNESVDRDRAWVRLQLRGIEPGLTDWLETVAVLTRCASVKDVTTGWERSVLRKSLLMGDQAPTKRQLAVARAIVAKLTAWSEEPARRRRGRRK
jgi:hypothetical protein